MSDPTEIAAEVPTPGLTPGLPQRYGGARPQRRVLPIVLGTLFALVLTAWAIWAGLASDDRAIDATVASYQVVDAHEIQVRIAAHFRDDKVQGSCLLRATASDHTIVGELNVTAAQLRTAGDSWIPIRTERRATTAEVVRCTD